MQVRTLELAPRRPDDFCIHRADHLYGVLSTSGGPPCEREMQSLITHYAVKCGPSPSYMCRARLLSHFLAVPRAPTDIPGPQHQVRSTKAVAQHAAGRVIRELLQLIS